MKLSILKELRTALALHPPTKERLFMYVISECAVCVIVSFTLGAFLFAFCLLCLMIKDGLENRTGRSPTFHQTGTLFGRRLATVVARRRESNR